MVTWNQFRERTNAIRYRLRTSGRDSRTKEGTSLANKVFNNIAKCGGEADSTFDNKWHVGPKMTDSLGVIASGYINDDYDDLIDARYTGGDPKRLSLDTGVLEKVLGEIGRTKDKTGLETLTAAMLLKAKAENMDYLNDLDGARDLRTPPQRAISTKQHRTLRGV